MLELLLKPEGCQNADRMNSGIEILLINANSREQDIFSFALNDLHLDYTCRFARSIKDASRKLSTIIPDYIFIDVKETKPGEFISFKQIKKMAKLKDTRVIIRSDDNIARSNEKVVQWGAARCINKTSSISDLIYTLKEILVNDISTQAVNN